MHQNTKNFYELLDIKKKISLSFLINPVVSILPPNIKVNVNEYSLYTGIVTEKILLKQDIALLDSIDIKIQLYDKNYNISSETAIIIESLKINNFEIIPNWTQLATYENDHNNTQPSNYLGFNGTWTLEMPEPFYRWKHKITGQGWLLEP